MDRGSVADGTQDLTVNIQGTTLDVTSDVQVEADDFTGAFSNSSANTHPSQLGELSITNLTAPISGSQDDREVTVTINSVAAPGDPSTGTLGKIVVGFTLDWSTSGNDYTFSSDDSSLDITYTITIIAVTV